MARALKKVPRFAVWEQEEHFWEHHSSADYAFTDVPVEEHIRLNPRRRTRRHMRKAQLKNPFAA